MKTNQRLSGAIMAVLAVSAILIGDFAMGIASEQRTLSLSNWVAPPEVLDIEGNPKTTFHPGETLIIHYTVERQPLKCWAIWIDVISGPVSYQFTPQRSQVLVDKVTRMDIRLIKTLPDPLPPGEYTWSQLAFPTCEGRDMTPFKHDTGITITILPK